MPSPASPVLSLLHDLVAAKSPSREEGPAADVLEGWLRASCARVGGDVLRNDRNVAAIAVKGRIVQVGVMAGGAVQFNLGALLPKRASLTGTVLRARPLEEKIAVSQRFAAEVLPFLESGALRVVIDTRYRLDDIATAHAFMETNANVGKILVDVTV